MGSVLGRASRASPTTMAEFPAPPRIVNTKNTNVGTSMQGEIEHGRTVAMLFQNAEIKSLPTQTAGATAPSKVDDNLRKLSVDELTRAIVLHAQNPRQHSIASLALQFGLTDAKDVACLQSALEHCIPYTVVEGPDNRLVGEAVRPLTVPSRSE